MQGARLRSHASILGDFTPFAISVSDEELADLLVGLDVLGARHRSPGVILGAFMIFAVSMDF